MRLLFILAIAVLVLVGISIILGGAWYYFELSKDPLVEIDRRYSPLKTFSQTRDLVNNHGEARVYHDIQLIAQDYDTTRITVSIPNPMEATRLPVMVVLGGAGDRAEKLGPYSSAW